MSCTTGTINKGDNTMTDLQETEESTRSTSGTGTNNFLSSVPRVVNGSEGHAIFKSFAYKCYSTVVFPPFLSRSRNNR